ncbi:molybdate ABC transporter substrate-binding protein [Cellvibrio sp. PSBB023]|uniref:molybdate ABC transporter substrate-binding protein n=1 Tax=Cellvibrio sp. PSBB023 TaxID=1945512 RepID=UPI00098FB857|nr:molybdate ABC transporter substrate-binding protein [Cellvibrio sp. PSBB023]AQT60820.1 molybdate ABC transporter substrate-binding protein [Cellvibrio sp. PSBB023]
MGKHRLRNQWASKATLWTLLWIALLFVGAVQGAEVRVYAAASLTDVVTELAQRYEKQHDNISIKTAFAGSSTLAKQIENGAPADVFISADKEWADYLAQRKLLASDSRKELLVNSLVLIAPRTATVPIELTADKTLVDQFQGKLCTGDPASVPVGKYARQALGYYGWWNSIASRLVGTEDVRTALAFVERGECALGIVYKTDAQMSQKVSVVAQFPAQAHQPIVYPGALTKIAGNDAAAFWQFLQSPEAIAVFNRYGFSTSP